MISLGENILVITRRYFENDIRRHFVGKVLQTNSVGMRVEGYVFTYDESINEFARCDEKRTRIVSFSDSGMVLVILPPQIDLEKLSYSTSPDGKRFLTDSADFKMNVIEFSTHR